MSEPDPIEPIALAIARSDADYDGRPFDKLGRADRERYLERARLSARAAVKVVLEAVLVQIGTEQ